MGSTEVPEPSTVSDVLDNARTFGDCFPEALWEDLDDLPLDYLRVRLNPEHDPIREYLQTHSGETAGSLRSIPMEELRKLPDTGPRRLEGFLEMIERMHRTWTDDRRTNPDVEAFYEWSLDRCPQDDVQDLLEGRLGIGRPTETMRSMGERHGVSRQSILQREKEAVSIMSDPLGRHVFENTLKPVVEQALREHLEESEVLREDELYAAVSERLMGERAPFYRRLFPFAFSPPKQAVEVDGLLFADPSVHETFQELRAWLDTKLDDPADGNAVLPVGTLKQRIEASGLEEVPAILNYLMETSDRAYREGEYVFGATGNERFATSAGRPVREALLVQGEPSSLETIHDTIEDLYGPLDVHTDALGGRVRQYPQIFTRAEPNQAVYALVEWGWAPDRTVRATIQRILEDIEEPISYKALLERVQERWPTLNLEALRKHIQRGPNFTRNEERMCGLTKTFEQSDLS